MAGELLAFDIGRLLRNRDYWEEHLYDGLNAAPARERFTLAGQEIIKTIHTIAVLHEDHALDQVEVYIGRAGASPRHVLNRWRGHYQTKKHRHGVIVLQSATEKIARWEDGAVKVLKRLDHHGRLCVKNASASGQGALPDEPQSCIYITWRRTTPRNLETCDKRTVENVAAEVAEETDLPRDQLEAALAPLTSPQRARAYVVWHPDHED
jgi:hypothetical protein